MNRFKKLLALLLFISNVASAELQKDSLDQVKVSDLTEDWLYYDKQFNSFFPYTVEGEEVNSISNLVDLNKYELYNLNFIAAPGLSLFVEQRLWYKNNTGKTEFVKLPIRRVTATVEAEKELLTFYHPQGELPLNSFFIGHTLASDLPVDTISKAPEMISRNPSRGQDVFIVAFLSILVLLAMLRNRYPKKFYEFSHFSSIVPSMEEDVIWDLSSVPVLLFVLVNSLCSALILFLIHQQFDLNTLDFLNVFHEQPVLGILTVSAGFFLIFLLKYLYLKILSWIFNLKGIIKIQFFELMKVSFKINLFLAVLTMIFYCSSYFQVQIGFDYFFYFTVISLFVVIMRVGYLAFKFSGFRNIYLFSYLCTTEILPLVIIVKMILF